MLLRNQKRANRPEVRGEILVFADPRQSRDWLAGAEGIEPSNAGIKIQCLNQLGDSPTQLGVCRYIPANSGSNFRTKFRNPCNVKRIFCLLFLQIRKRMMRDRPGLPGFPALWYRLQDLFGLLLQLE